MNSKAFAIFVGAIMVLSAFAGFVLMGSDQSEIPVAAADSYSLENFKATGNLVDWDFEGIQDVLEMAPENTVMAYWVNLSAPANLTAAARAALPQSMDSATAARCTAPGLRGWAAYISMAVGRKCIGSSPIRWATAVWSYPMRII